ncbi:CobW/HypB/UreG, nucleotide-binding domain-containing protein [Pseudomassariella vexata]|uniref:CobW/HypB/UreG, nucleotide-binding domain-domain-containing protein n=1 Tax=Pseudomassariella vexata TaxID=1141098 RepID=A0A1Y2EIL7_9PEZI|nr:CobW/HypB/UreG, nucleotide-binding domain-containing protein [Pseudomassariella vexata]ORY71418.1 CobW/HypB/UreG, nucleotide-binding domain-domain-containing protein [Pseudomassariella vexata]
MAKGLVSVPSKAKAASKNKQVKAAPPRALPVTLLSGFLGSGKTTLLQHILKSDHGLRIAVIVNDIGAINVDASLIKKNFRKTKEKVVQLQNGCICCTLRGDLLEELVYLSELGEFDYVIVESSGISEPQQVAETFDSELASRMAELGSGDDALDESMKKVLTRIANAGGVGKFAHIDTCVTVIDAFEILNDFNTDQLISATRNDVTKEDERTVSDLMIDQIEFADVIVLNKIDMVDEATQRRIIDLVSTLNRNAKVIKSSYGKLDVNQIVNTKLFNLERAQIGFGWLQDLHEMTLREVNGRMKVTPKPETEEYNVRNFVYTRSRPFHPRRLWKLLYDKFILQMQHEDDEEDSMDEDDETDEEDEDDTDVDMEDEDEDPLNPPSNQEILANKSSNPIISRLFRSKGEFFLATRPHRAGEWSQAGAMLTLIGGRPWFCTLPEEDYITGNKEIDALVLHDIKKGGEWGDRRQELVFIGENLDIKGISGLLDECLLNDEEWEAWVEVMSDSELESNEARMEALEQLFDDGFPDWPEDHDHDSEH